MHADYDALASRLTTSRRGGLAMLSLMVLSIALASGDDPASQAPAADDVNTYQGLRAQAGRDADSQVKLALWCEAHGLTTERLKHFTIATIVDPSHALARGLLGFVRDGGTWRKAEDVARRAIADPALAAARAEYQKRRTEMADKAEAHWQLALWCEQNGLKAESTAHLHRAVVLDPKRDEAWKLLGYKKHGQAWLTDAQVAAAKAESDAQTKANQSWRPILEKAKVGLATKAHKAEAEAKLASVTDPRAVPMVVKTFGIGKDSNRLRLVQILGQIDDPSASRVLAIEALVAKSADVRRAATETLSRRDPRDYADFLIGLLRDPIKYEVKPVKGPGSKGELWVEGQRYDRKRVYQTAAAPNVTPQPGDRVTTDPNGQLVIIRDLGVGQTGYQSAAILPPWPGFMGSGFGISAYGPGAGMTPYVPPGGAMPGSAIGSGSPHVGRTLTPRLPGATPGSHTPPFAASYSPAFNLSPAMMAQLVQSNFMAEAAASGDPFQMYVAANMGDLIPRTDHSHYNFVYQREAVVPVGRMNAEAETSAVLAQRQLDADVATLEAHNAPIHQKNRKILSVLETATGQTFGEDSKAWKAWFVDQVGYTLVQAQASNKDTVVETVQVFTPISPVSVVDVPFAHTRISCFGAGTLVRTMNGNAPIESLQVGDLVLAQDTTNGSLSFQPILMVHCNPPSATLKLVTEEGEPIVSSTFHRFWRPGSGWAMARELKPADTIRTLAGVTRLRAVEPGDVQPVFNLDVAESKTFFVGRQAVLAHDNSLPDLRSTPFDSLPAPIAANAPVP
jgi:hypothetical protein